MLVSGRVALFQGFTAVQPGHFLKKPAVRRSSIFLCTNPMYYCGLAKGCVFFQTFMSPLNTLCKRLAWWGLVAQKKVIKKKTGQLSHELGPNISNYQTGSFFNGLNKTILGYFGLPMLYMVPHEDWSRQKKGGWRVVWIPVWREIGSQKNIYIYIYTSSGYGAPGNRQSSGMPEPTKTR